MVRRKRKGVVKEAQTGGGSAAPHGVDLRMLLDKVPINYELDAVLGGGDLEQWFDALCASADNLYDQLKRLQLFRSRCKAALASGLNGWRGDFAVAVWRLVFRLFAAPAAHPLRKNFFLILEVLALSDSSDSKDVLTPSALQIAAAEELRTLLDTLWSEQTKKQPMTPEDRVQMLDRMMHIVEFPYLARVLVENPVATSSQSKHEDATYLLHFVEFCAEQLAALGKPIVDFHASSQTEQQTVATNSEDQEDTTSTNVVLLASERCGHALKSVIMLATMKETLDNRLQQCAGATQDAMSAAFLRITAHCVLLLQTDVVHKDLLTQAGLAYCLLLRLLLKLTVEPSAATKLLLQAAYPEQTMVHIESTCTSAPLRAHVEKDMLQFGDLSRLSIYRGLLNSLSDHELSLSSERLGLDNKHFRQQSTTKRSVLDVMFTAVQQFCQRESHNTRLYAFQVLEAFLRRAVLILKQQKAVNTGYTAMLGVDTLTTLTTAVLLNWEHPSKKVNQFMAAVFAHIVHYFVLSGDFPSWKDGILPRLVELPPTSRAKYGALALLVGEAGAKALLEAQPALLSSLLAAVGQKDYAAPAAANLFAQILDELNGSCSSAKGKKNGSAAGLDDEAKSAWRQLWLPDVVGVLLSRDANLRLRVAMYVVPLLLKKDPECVPILVDYLRDEATKEQTDEEAADVALWALLEVLKYARKKMAPEKLMGVSTVEIERGLRHANWETRGTAFDALCASLKSTSMPTKEELCLIKCFLVVNGKEIGSAGRMSTLIGLKTVLIRIKETLRLAGKTGRPTDFATAQAFKHWVELFIVTSVYPGALPQRMTLGLEVMLLYVQLFGFGGDETGYVENDGHPRSLLLSSQMVTTLLNMLISAWDSIRSLAFTVLELYPSELPGYSSREGLHTLMDWAVGLCCSPRQRESDAGALFIRLLFQKCSGVIQNYDLVFKSPQKHAEEPASSTSANPEVAFVLQLTHVILTRVQALSPAEVRKGASPLVHGFLLSLRYVLENVAFDQLSQEQAADWPLAMTQVFACVHQSMRASLSIVGDATSGVGDEELSASFAGVVGEVSAVAQASASALRVDCRGHLIVETGDGDMDGEEEDGNAEQRAVVGSWLAARECGAILELLMRRVPLPQATPSSSDVSFFTAEMAQRGGETLLNSLFELKHKGAVATAYQAFEGVCRAFLAHGEHNAMLGGLPARWADRLLARLERSEQHFILRRSSGFAFSFVAILRAEPRNSAAVILPRVMATLLRLAGQDTDAAEQHKQHQEHHTLWRARVHALNILKLVCQDGVLAEDVARYVVDMFELAVRGFDCGSWAVRNSAMMLFAAATQRAIGDKRIADGGSNQQVASDDVFSRFQQLRGFLVRELSRLLNTQNAPATGALGGAAPPGLYPLLLFLSRLRPGEDDEERDGSSTTTALTEEGSGLASFVPLVMKCASQPTMAIRQMAARVVASIVSHADAAFVLSTLCEKLPRGVTTEKSSSVASNSKFTHNYVHGVLAQIRQLTAKYLTVDAGGHSASGVRNGHAQLFTVAVTQLLPSTEWLWAAGRCSPACTVLRAELLASVDVIVRYYAADPVRALSGLQQDARKDELVTTFALIRSESEKQLKIRCGETHAAGALESTRPGMYVADRTLVSIWFTLWELSVSSEPRCLHSLIPSLLDCSVLQIRKKATKQLANWLLSTDTTGTKLAGLVANDVALLQTVLTRQFLVETHPKLRARQLQLLVDCHLRQPTGETQTSLVQAKLLQTLKDSADAQVLAPALTLLALLAHHSRRGDTDSETTNLFQTVGHEVKQHSQETQPVVLRQAAATALRYSGLLLHTTEASQDAVGVDLALGGWMSALRLLQDDDVSVRALARGAVLVALSANSSLGSNAVVVMPPGDSLSDAAVLPLAVEFTVATFASSSRGIATLSTMLLELMDAPAALAAYTGSAGAKAQDWDDLCRRIFESESSNYFAESDVLAQNLVYHLVGGSAGCVEQPDAVLGLREKVLLSVVKALTTLNAEAQRSREQGGQWLGGVTYYSSVFSSLFALLAAGVAVLTSTSAPLAPKLDALVSQVRQLAQETCDGRIANDATHPLVHRALELLADGQASQKQMTATKPVAELLYLTPYWAALSKDL